MKNTIQPDRVYLNLSKTEFNGIELPEDLVDYFNSDERLIINWVDGENTKSMKKVFPSLEYLDDNDFIIDGDDDMLFPPDLIESRLNDFEKYGRKYPITSNSSRSGVGDALVISPLTLFQKKMLNNWNKYVDNTVLHTYNDDRTYMYILYLNGYIAKPASKYNKKELITYYDLHLDNTSMGHDRLYPVGRNYDKAVEKTVFNLTHTTIDKAFGFFNTKKYDCVMPYSKSGVDSKAMSCGMHLEIEYVIASLKKYCSSWCGRIFIIGSEPPDAIKKDVIYIPCDDPYTHFKDANIIHKLRYACENIPDLSEDFLMISDDQIVTKESTWEDMTPRIIRKYSDWSEKKWQINRKTDIWHEALYQTLNLFPKNKAAFWEPHIWSPMNKMKFIEMCKEYDYEHNIACITLSLYYNYINQPIVKNFDHIHLINNDTGIRNMRRLDLNNLTRHLSWTDKPFGENEFRNLLDKIVGFDEEISAPSEIDTIKNKIQQIKSRNDGIRPSRRSMILDDISAGRIVKIPHKNGYVWKRIK